MISRRLWLGGLAGGYALWWTALAFDPVSRSDWWLENVLVLVGVGVLVATHDKLSRAALLSCFAFLALHAIGAHYTYSEVPYDRIVQAQFGFSPNELFGASRNHFDRIAHFAYGLMITPPLRELLQHRFGLRGFWSYFLPFEMTVTTSTLYELLEWAAAVVFGGDLGTAFLGTQGDEWDAQKDMLCATLGAFASMGIAALVEATTATRSQPAAP